jgi:hypothetical protein
MKKENLVEFIQKYYLGGTLTKDSSNDWNPVPINVENGTAKVTVRSTDKSVLAVIDQDLELPDGEFVVGNTKQFLSMLSAFGTDINLEFQKVKQDYVNVLKLSDSDISATFALADPQQIEERASLKGLPEMHINFTLKKDFVQNFSKAKKALSDAPMFAVIPNNFDNTAEFIVNYEPGKNVNSIKVLVTDVEIIEEFSPLYFSCNNFVAILTENTDYREASISISLQGVMAVKFTGEDYTANYYLKSFEINE